MLSLIPQWISHLKKSIYRLSANNTISKQMADQFNNALDHYSNRPELHMKSDHITNTINNYYLRLISEMLIHIEHSQEKIRIFGDYPFNNDTQSGVMCTVRIIQENMMNQAIKVLESTHKSELGTDSQMANGVRVNIKKNIHGLDWLKKGLKLLGKKITDTFTSQYHAELAWCINDSQKIVDQIVASSDFKKYPPLNSENIGIFSQLVQTPRVEIITSSACCEKCRIIFSALRLYLNDKNIHIPIILYANKSYNGTNTYIEEHGSIYIINSKGEFVNINRQCEVPITRGNKAEIGYEAELYQHHTRQRYYRKNNYVYFSGPSKTTGDVGYKCIKKYARKHIVDINGKEVNDEELEKIILRSQENITSREMFYLMDKNLKDLQFLMLIGGGYFALFITNRTGNISRR